MRLISILLSLILITSTVYAEIRPTSDLNQIKQAIFVSNKDTLVIFDIDMVLIMPTDQIFIKYVDHESGPFLESVFNDIKTRRSVKEIDELKSIIQLAGHVKTVAPDTARIFNEIQKSGYKILGLTLCETGAYGNIPSLEKWRVNELKHLGMKFHHSFPNVKAGQLDPFIPDIEKYTAKYSCSPSADNGIVFTCHVPKGDVLDAYLQKINLRPRKIIFIDDKMKNLQTVETYCKQNNIEFLGFEYNAVKDQAKQFVMNLRLARLQFAVLEQTHVWLSDAQASTILNAVDQNVSN